MLPASSALPGEPDVYTRTMALKKKRDEKLAGLRKENVNRELFDHPYAPAILELSSHLVGDRPESYITDVLAQPKAVKALPRGSCSGDYLKSRRGGGNARRAPPPPSHLTPPLKQDQEPGARTSQMLQGGKLN